MVNPECWEARRRVAKLRVEQAAGTIDSDSNRAMVDCLLVHVSDTAQVIEGNHDIVLKPLATNSVFDRQSIADRDPRLQLIGQNPGCD